MPEPTYSPIVAGAIASPRQLNRWLDKNPIAKLTRAQTYVTLTAFSVSKTWLDYSEVVAIFNLSAGRNFSFLSVNKPANPNYLLCVMWLEDGVTHRYALWQGVGEVIYFDLPLYTNQIIKSNFRFEIWNTGATSSQATALTLYTSIQQPYDYMYVDDVPLAPTGAISTVFQSPNMNLPFVFQSVPTSN